MRVARSNKYTNKDFKENFVDLASNKVKKGHLTKQERDVGDNQVVEGVLKYIIKDRIEFDGWYVEVGSGKDKFVYHCANQDPFTIPDSTETETKYVPKKKTKVQFIMDKHNKIYTINRILTDQKVALSLYKDQLRISVDNNNKTNQDVNAVITMGKEAIQMVANSIVIKDNDDNQFDLIENQQNHTEQIQTLTAENELLKNKINNIEQQLTQLNTQDE